MAVAITAHHRRARALRVDSVLGGGAEAAELHHMRCKVRVKVQEVVHPDDDWSCDFGFEDFEQGLDPLLRRVSVSPSLLPLAAVKAARHPAKELVHPAMRVPDIQQRKRGA